MNKVLLRKYIANLTLLFFSLILLWVIFYVLTRQIMEQNMQQQALISSESIISRIEEDLLSLENAAYELGTTDAVNAIITTDDNRSFYDAASSAEDSLLIGTGMENADNIVIFRSDGLFYRIKGSIPNTALKRAFYLMEREEMSTVTVSSGGNTYIGACETVIRDGRKIGYILLLMEQAKIEQILNVYNDLDYLGVALVSGDKLLYSNRISNTDQLKVAIEEAVFCKEKEIGLSGCRLLVYCERGITGSLSTYFRIAMPVTILILIFVMLLSARYMNRNLIDPINNVERALYETQIRVQESELENERTLIALLKKQISAHFTVNTLNVVRSLINKGEKESASRICDELSALLRYANAADEYISLLEEFWVLEQYTGIMQIRYPGRITAQIESDDAFEKILIPRMLLQPIVENAIIHGLAGGVGTVGVSAKLHPDEVIITVEDDGCGMDADQLHKVTQGLELDDYEERDLNHIALQNIQRRIRMVCGEPYGLKIESAKQQGTKVYVHLPLKSAEA
ncbi:MAG: histidine kinase [Lachnospiraceae bacterium]|nr:histidine kinase [Lachnospiraceae bacterium]